jgi:outer membrane lipoprotein SlyB
MKKNLIKTTTATLVFALAFLGLSFILTSDAQAQTRRQTTRRVNDRQVEQIIRGIERRSDVFRRSFDAALDNGRRMMVTRSVFAEGLNQAIEVKSFYDRTSETAQFNLVNNNTNASTNPNLINNFTVPDNTTIVAALNANISTRDAREGDRFTMTVRSPSQYADAIIEGYVSNANRSGRITGRSEITLNYETIRLRNNQTYRFAGITENVRANSGENVRIDNENAVREGDNQTSQTIGRTAIGAGIGALLGAILGGGQGAAIGAAVGAGTGAGSVYIQGRDDLELTSGAEFTIRASSPRDN